jgi:two-component system, NarL family, response regulator NreC
MKKIRILLADDHETVREGIKRLINAEDDMEVTGEAQDGEIAVKKTGEITPDVIVMDISMPNLNGLKATKKLRKIFPDLKILTLTRHTDSAYLQQLIKAGANGYVLKQSAPTQLISAIRAVNAGNSYLDPALSQKLMSEFAGRGETVLRGETKAELTDRESEVLRLIALGYSNKEIAARFNKSVKTIEAQKAYAMRKLQIHSRIDIVRYAILRGWMEND